MTDFIEIDGARGEGGGQILRSALALSLLAERPFLITNIRAGRKKPGLLRQHLTAVQAAVQIGQAQVEGNELGSSQLRFIPKKPIGGELKFDIGSAGSASLVLQTILPALALAEKRSTVIVIGGTHNPQSPPFDHLAKTFLPILAKMGPSCQLELSQYGFFPVGGGRIHLTIDPVDRLRSLNLLDRSESVKRSVRILLSKIPEHVANREAGIFQSDPNWSGVPLVIEKEINSPGPGNAVLVSIESETITEVFSALGERGVTAEKVALKVRAEAEEYLEASVPVGRYTADQILLPMAIAAAAGSGSSRFRTLSLSEHSLTHIDLIRAFLDVTIRFESDIIGMTTVIVEKTP